MQERLIKLTRRAEDDDKRRQEQAAQAESQRKELLNSAKWLRVQNADLERKLEAHKPEMENALLARESSFKKLRHTRKVIRDLLEERVCCLIVAFALLAGLVLTNGFRLV